MVVPEVTGDVETYSVPEQIEEPPGSWRFKHGQCISHRDQPMPSLVMTRVKAGGMEVYGVRSFAVADPQRDRVMLGEVLIDVAPGDKPCEQCLLFRSSLCPGDLR